MAQARALTPGSQEPGGIRKERAEPSGEEKRAGHKGRGDFTGSIILSATKSLDRYLPFSYQTEPREGRNAL